MEMNWRGDNCRNFESRRGVAGMVICNHITAGTAESCYNWFTSPNNNNASAHFTVRRDGTIDQYVRIEEAAWTQGIPIPEGLSYATAPIVKAMGCNPNLYCISIEHEGYIVKDDDDVVTEVCGLDGTLTDPQFYASCWLHRYIKDEVRRLWDVEITLGNYNVIGHFQIDPRRKPLCPGLNFPWNRLYAELAIAEGMTLEDYEGRITYLQSDAYQAKQAYGIANEVLYLADLAETGEDGKASWAKDQLLSLYPVMKSFDLVTDEEASADKVQNEILFLYDKAKGKDGDAVWSRQQLLQLYPYMLQAGLL